VLVIVVVVLTRLDGLGENVGDILALVAGGKGTGLLRILEGVTLERV
jgi:hypothetical protein